MKIRIVITGRSYHTAGRLPKELTLPPSATVDDALEVLTARLDEGERLPSSCLIALSGEHLGTLNSHVSRPLRDNDELVLIAPVAGG